MPNYIVNQTVSYLRRVWVQAETAEQAWESANSGNGVQIGVPTSLGQINPLPCIPENVVETDIDPLS